MLFANRIIDLDFSAEGREHAGKNSLEHKHPEVKLGMSSVNNGPPILAFLDERKWGGMYFISCAHPPEKPSSAVVTLSQLTVANLKEKLRAAGKPVSGKKSQLICRLTEVGVEMKTAAGNKE